MRICINASGTEYRMDEQFRNLIIFGILIVFQFEKFIIYKIPKKFNLEN